MCSTKNETSDHQAPHDLLLLFRGSEAFLHKTLLYFWSGCSFYVTSFWILHNCVSASRSEIKHV